MHFFRQFNPFPEIIGNAPVKLVLTLPLVEPRCGGVLILGRKGTGKSSILRCFKKFLKISKISYVEIPLGITYETLIGGIDIEETLRKGNKVYEKGLLEKAEGKFLLIDDINLFPEEYLGLIFEKSEKLNIIATLNPEEGFISPHFLDRFGLCAMMENIKDLKKKLEFVKFFNTHFDPEKIHFECYQNFSEYIQKVKTFKERVEIKEDIFDKITEIVVNESVFSHRTEIFLFYASLAYTLLRGDTFIKEAYIKEIAPFVLSHRKEIRNNSQFQEEKQEKRGHKNETENFSQIQREEEGKLQERSEISKKDENYSKEENNKFSEIETILYPLQKEEIFTIGEIFKPKQIVFKKDRVIRNIIGRRTKSKTELKGGKILRSVLFSKDRDLDVFGTIKAAAPFQILRGREDKLIIQKEDFRYKEKERKIGHLIIFLVDASGSMGVQKRMEAVKGAIFSLLTDCYQKRDKVSMIMFRKDKAEMVLPPTSSVELAYKKLKDLPTGGKTPLPLGLLEAYKLIRKAVLKYPKIRIILILLSDGKANVAINPEKDPFEEVKRICQEIRNFVQVDKVVVDCEIKSGFLKMDLAKDIANWLGACYFLLEDLKAENLVFLINKIKDKNFNYLDV